MRGVGIGPAGCVSMAVSTRWSSNWMWKVALNHSPKFTLKSRRIVPRSVGA